MGRDERKLGLAFAAALKELRSDAPDDFCRRDLNRTIATIQRRYGLSDEDKKREILTAIENGAATVGEIAEETGFPAATVSVLVAQLEESAVIRRQTMKVRAGKGRPSHFYTHA